jgi:hypothetical protein
MVGISLTHARHKPVGHYLPVACLPGGLRLRPGGDDDDDDDVDDDDDDDDDDDNEPI